MRKEQQRLLNIIVKLHQQIRILKEGKRVKRTPGRKNATTLAKPLKTKGRRTRVHPAVQNPVENQVAVPNDAGEQTVVPIEKEQQWTDIHVKIEMDEMLIRDKEIQTVAPPLGVIRVMNAKQHNKKIQVKLPASTAAWKRDPKPVMKGFEASPTSSRKA